MNEWMNGSFAFRWLANMTWLNILIFKTYLRKKESKKEKERKKETFERNKKAYSRFVNAFSWISKNYDFRFQIFCHIDVVLPYFCFRCGGGGASGTLSNYNIFIQKSEIQSQQCSYDTLAIKNTEAVLVIKWSAAQQNQQMTCAPSEDSNPPNLTRVFAVRLTEVNVISYPYSAQRRLWSDWADAQTARSLRWSHMSVCLCWRAQAQM